MTTSLAKPEMIFSPVVSNSDQKSFDIPDLGRIIRAILPVCGCGGTGRRAGFRSLWGKTRVSSTLTIRTNLSFPSHSNQHILTTD